MSVLYAEMPDESLLAEASALVAESGAICPDCGGRLRLRGEVIRSSLRAGGRYRQRLKAVVPVGCCKPRGEVFFIDEVAA